ncbi:MAG: TMEM198/TM7SF3 family protein [Lachnospiraceae bacterium]|nr:TMEM198/TM7SF3 family protein [Lachnospiraceae bacterium]
MMSPESAAPAQLIEQFAQMRFEGAAVYIVMMIVALIICFEGYRLYRLALLVIGFVTGYTQITVILGYFINLTDSRQILLIRVVAGLICAIASAAVVKVGVFLAVYSFVKESLATGIAMYVLTLLGKEDQIPPFLLPLVVNILGLAAAYVIAKLTTKFLQPVIIVLTAAVGGFCVVNLFLTVLPVLLGTDTFSPPPSSMIWTFARLGFTVVGILVQKFGKKS